jgi:hypothetical protein
VWIRNVFVKGIVRDLFYIYTYRYSFVCALKCLCEKRVIYITKYICESFSVHSLFMRQFFPHTFAGEPRRRTEGDVHHGGDNNSDI